MASTRGENIDTALTYRWRKASFEEHNKKALGLQHHLLIQPHLHTNCLVGTASVSSVEEDPIKAQIIHSMTNDGKY